MGMTYSILSTCTCTWSHRAVNQRAALCCSYLLEEVNVLWEMRGPSRCTELNMRMNQTFVGSLFCLLTAAYHRSLQYFTSHCLAIFEFLWYTEIYTSGCLDKTCHVFPCQERVSSCVQSLTIKIVWTRTHATMWSILMFLQECNHPSSVAAIPLFWQWC